MVILSTEVALPLLTLIRHSRENGNPRLFGFSWMPARYCWHDYHGGFRFLKIPEYI